MFNKAFEKLIQFEGGYVNDPDDTGGETYKGISRNNFPNWSGWTRIDYHKNEIDFELELKQDTVLDASVESFDKENFWDKMKCDLMPNFVAEEVFEASVNMGIHRATEILQTALNLLNNNQKRYKNIDVDGDLGSITIATLKVAKTKVSSKLMFNVLNFLQAKFYIELMERNEKYEKYIGWFNRIDIRK